MARHPPPDLGPALALEDPRARVQAVLCALYAAHRTRAPMTEKVLRDRSALPALDELMARTADVQTAGLAGALAAGFGVEDEAGSMRLCAAVAFALHFWTWQRLTLAFE